MNTDEERRASPAQEAHTRLSAEPGSPETRQVEASAPAAPSEQGQATRHHAPPPGPETRRIGASAAPAASPSRATETRQQVAPADPRTRASSLAAGAQPADAFISRNLPPELESQFRPIEELASGGQAAVLLCERIEAPHDHVAIKLYNNAMPDGAGDPRERLVDVPADYAVSYAPPYFGTANGRWWEVHEYLEIGSVKDFVRTQGGRLEPNQVADLVRGLVDALDHLHHRSPRIIHRDIKPANILLRSSSPVRAVLADFGVAILTDSTMTMRTSSRTEAYASPESTSGEVRPAWDWWSLGMTIAELAVGRHPYQLEDGRFLQEARIESARATKPVPLDHIDDPQLLLLLQGLLTRDPDHRWDQTNVRLWLEGGVPELGPEWTAPSTPARPDAAPLNFMGVEFTDPGELARAVTQSWKRAGSLLAGRDLDRIVDWIDDVSPDRSIRGLVDTYRAARRGSGDRVVGNLNLLMAKIVTRLDPEGVPIFMGEAVDLKSMSGWAARLGRGTSGHLKDVVDQLFHTGALHEYRRLAGHERLGGVHSHWEELSSQGERYFTLVPRAGEMTPEIRALTLRLAIVRVLEESTA